MVKAGDRMQSCCGLWPRAWRKRERRFGNACSKRDQHVIIGVLDFKSFIDFSAPLLCTNKLQYHSFSMNVYINFVLSWPSPPTTKAFKIAHTIIHTPCLEGWYISLPKCVADLMLALKLHWIYCTRWFVRAHAANRTIHKMGYDNRPL